MHVRYPIGLRTAPRPGATTFALLFALESVARSLLATVIPLQGLALLGNSRDLSLLFTGVGVTALLGSFLIPLLIRRITRRWTYTLGAVLLILAATALATVSLPGQIVGMLARVLGTACLNITASLYIMQYVQKRDLAHAEPRRLQFSALAWTLGPSAGVALYQWLGPNWPYLLSASASASLIGFFWWLRLREDPALPAAVRPPPRPARSVGRFIAQPRLRLAWLIAFGRSTWWAFFFSYTPIYMVRSGYSELAGALVISMGNGLLFLTPVFGKLGVRYGLRKLILLAYLGAGMCTLGAALAFHLPPLAVALLLGGALSCCVLDALGNLPFMRSVHAHERPEMTTVFRTYLDCSELLPPALFALLLSFFPLGSVFVAEGLIALSVAYWVRYLPRRL